MKSAPIVLFTLFVSFCAAAEAPPSRVSTFIGTKNISDNTWEPFDSQFEFGVAADVNIANLPVNFYVGMNASIDKRDSGDDEGKTVEKLFGISKHFPIGGSPFNTYVMGGVAHIEGELTKSGVTQKDSAVGYFVGGGIVWNFTQHFDIGFETRYSQAEIKFDDKDVDVGGTHLGVTAGFNW